MAFPLKGLSRMAALGVLGALALHPFAAGAQVQFVKNAPGNPDENVLFQLSSQIGNPVYGVTNQTAQKVRFESNESLTAESAMGQAVLKATDGALTHLCIDLDVAGNTMKFFEELEFKLDTNRATGTINFTADYVDTLTSATGQASGQLNLSAASGQNRFNIIADPNILLSKVCFDTSVGVTEALQFRIGGVQKWPPDDFSEVPEPGSLALLAGGALPVLGYIRRRRK